MLDNPERRRFLRQSLLGGAALSLPGILTSTSCAAEDRSGQRRTPVVLDTDIGDDIDDTWALLMLLRCADLDLRYALTGFGNTVYRSRVLAKNLQLTGNGHVPVGIGLEPEDKPGNQSEWLEDYRLDDYPGEVHEDGISRMIEVVMNSREQVTLLCIGPVTNIAEALRREPGIARNARFVGMQGSVYRGYDGESEPSAEWNVKMDPAAFAEVIAAPWECTITPLDTCGIFKLEGERYQQVYRSDDGWLKSLVENYRLWIPKATWLDPRPDIEKSSSTLFDTVAVYLAMSEELVKMEKLPLVVTPEGYTRIDSEKGHMVRCATGWKDLEGFGSLLVEILTSRGLRRDI